MTVDKNWQQKGQAKGKYRSVVKTEDKLENHEKQVSNTRGRENRHRSSGDERTTTDKPTESEGTTQA